MKKSLQLLAFVAALCAQIPAVEVLALPSIRVVRSVPVARGWARNQINAVIFRHNSVISFRDHQYVAFYDAERRLVLAKRRLGTDRWEVHPTQYSGDTNDAHKSISLAVDGQGYLHVAWNQHGTKLQYCRSRSPESLDLSEEMPMIGHKENRVTYPEFYDLPGGGLLFLYRDGSSGNGDLMLNRYDLKSGRWVRLQDGLINGEGSRNAYWQMTVDRRGVIHLSWVWRETGDVATNHDLCYARSMDGGKTWRKSSGEKYSLPITAASAEYAVRIPQRSELINQTSMAADALGHPYIASYWRAEETSVPQYRIVYFNGRRWQVAQVSDRRTGFTLQGLGTRRIPISRPQLLLDKSVRNPRALIVFRDAERGERVSLATCRMRPRVTCATDDLTDYSVGLWEPTFDPVAWRRLGELHLFVQKVGQGEGENLEDIPPQLISILEVRTGSGSDRVGAEAELRPGSGLQFCNSSYWFPSATRRVARK